MHPIVGAVVVKDGQVLAKAHRGELPGKPGVVYKDANLMVTAFLVKHGSWDEAFGYRFDALDRNSSEKP